MCFGATFPAPAPSAPAPGRRGASAGAAVAARRGGGRGQARVPALRGHPGAGGMTWGSSFLELDGRR